MEIVSFCVFTVIKSIDKHLLLRKVDCEIYITPWSRNSTHFGINLRVLTQYSLLMSFVITCANVVE